MKMIKWLVLLLCVGLAGTAVSLSTPLQKSALSPPTLAAKTITTTQDPEGPASICGLTDNRVLSSDSRVGRLSFVNGTDASGDPIIGGVCTAWLISSGIVLTAGHCVDFDPDNEGSMLPNGVLDVDTDDFVEFNPPASTADGTRQPAPPERRYAIDLDSIVWNFDGTGNGLGDDWAVMRLLPNAVTGELAGTVQGGFRVSNSFPDVDTTLRLTGHGNDLAPDPTRHRVQQTHTGPLTSLNAFTSVLGYQVDTMGGNSGGPVIWEANQYTIGIHTNAGCDMFGGANYGTAFSNLNLQMAMNTIANDATGYETTATIYVDNGTIFPLTANGTVFKPLVTFSSAYSAANPGNKISLMAGDYDNEGGVLDKQTLIVAPVGPVVIGQ